MPALRRRRVKQRSSHTRERNQRTASAQNGALRSRPEEFRNTILSRADIVSWTQPMYAEGQKATFSKMKEAVR